VNKDKKHNYQIELESGLVPI